MFFTYIKNPDDAVQVHLIVTVHILSQKAALSVC